MKSDSIDGLYVHPRFQSLGIGSALLIKARSLSPQRLELHTHQANQQARTFYESHGFEIVESGISLAPESAPELRYLWIADKSD
ncbi:MAG: GNAT family N-acetyltransferase [Planctomycetota bacterium]|nr:GNAT family N-acetyltransferase [Planctomycetota bacterium]